LFGPSAFRSGPRTLAGTFSGGGAQAAGPDKGMDGRTVSPGAGPVAGGGIQRVRFALRPRAGLGTLRERLVARLCFENPNLLQRDGDGGRFSQNPGPGVFFLEGRGCQKGGGGEEADVAGRGGEGSFIAGQRCRGTGLRGAERARARGMGALRPPRAFIWPDN